VDSVGRWLGAYVPACFRGYPFSLSRLPNSEKLVLCVDESSGLVTENGNEPLFDKNGELAPPVKEVLDFLQQVARNRSITDQGVAALSDAGVIREWPLSVTIDGEKIQLEGLYRIDDGKLNNLDDQKFLKLRKAGALPIAYAQLLSMANTRIFQKLAQLHAQVKTQPKVDLDKLLGDDDIFKF